MPKSKSSIRAAVLPVEEIILTVRGERVILDHHLAVLYGVTTKALNQAVKRNPGRFPADFVFLLTFQEVTDLRSQSVTSSARRNRSQFVTGFEKHRNPRFLPYAFTEHGALMAANVLRSQRAVEMSLFVVRAFVRLRDMARNHVAWAAKLDALERKVKGHDTDLEQVFAALRALIAPGRKSRRQIGFRL